MGSGKCLSNKEKAQIDVLVRIGYSKKKIAETIERSRCAVRNYISNPIQSVGEKRGPKFKLSPTTKRRIITEAGCTVTSAAGIVASYNLPVSVRTVQRVLHQSPYLIYRKMLKSPRMTPKHQAARLKWCEGKLNWKYEWHHWVFTDEKKFNLDGPDGWAHYWWDKRKEERVFTTRQNGGGSVMVWGAFGIQGQVLHVIEGIQDSQKYVDTLQGVFLQHFSSCAEQPCYFQQDGASIHTSKLTKTFLDANLAWCKDWPAKSPDLNPIENLWSLLSRMIYANCTQYNNVVSLTAAIHKAWNEISETYLDNLINSMPKRMKLVVEKRGKAIPY